MGPEASHNEPAKQPTPGFEQRKEALQQALNQVAEITNTDSEDAQAARKKAADMQKQADKAAMDALLGPLDKAIAVAYNVPSKKEIAAKKQADKDAMNALLGPLDKAITLADDGRSTKDVVSKADVLVGSGVDAFLKMTKTAEAKGGDHTDKLKNNEVSSDSIVADKTGASPDEIRSIDAQMKAIAELHLTKSDFSLFVSSAERKGPLIVDKNFVDQVKTVQELINSGLPEENKISEDGVLGVAALEGAASLAPEGQVDNLGGFSQVAQSILKRTNEQPIAAATKSQVRIDEF
ncbi:hypothetical protein KBD59_05705 [Candidatus Gracilibacteria bacterium]|nr:hypothetical protein [Candidatus Gracilibacteria bacterium]